MRRPIAGLEVIGLTADFKKSERWGHVRRPIAGLEVIGLTADFCCIVSSGWMTGIVGRAGFQGDAELVPERQS